MVEGRRVPWWHWRRLLYRLLRRSWVSGKHLTWDAQDEKLTP